MNTQEMLRVIRRHTREAILDVMRIVVNYREGQKQWEKIALHLKSTLARPPIQDRAYTTKPLTASPGNSVVVTKTSSLIFFVQPDKMSLVESTSLQETDFLKIFDKNTMRNF